MAITDSSRVQRLVMSISIRIKMWKSIFSVFATEFIAIRRTHTTHAIDQFDAEIDGQMIMGAAHYRCHWYCCCCPASTWPAIKRASYLFICATQVRNRCTVHFMLPFRFVRYAHWFCHRVRIRSCHVLTMIHIAQSQHTHTHSRINSYVNSW